MSLSNQKAEQIARIHHAANNEYRITNGLQPLAPWDQLAEDKRQGKIKAVIDRASGPVSPKEQHERWSQSMKAQGYVQGPESHSAGALAHPDIDVAYEDLPASSRERGALFGAIVLALAQ